MSISGLSEAESVFWEEPYTIPGPCKTFCLRCPCPSILTTVAFVLGIVAFSTGAILAGEETVLLFLNTGGQGNFISWNGYIKWAISVQLVLMVLLAIILLAMGFLGTGSTRKERYCKFKNRSTGRCQTFIFMVVAYFMFILWLAECFLALAPVMFFVIQNRGVCQAPHFDETLLAQGERPIIVGPDTEICIDLRQWAIVPIDQEENYAVCGSKVIRICEDSWVLWFWCICFGGALVVLFAVLHYLINMSANFAKLRKGFKKGRVDRKTSTYIIPPSKASSRAGSLRGSRRSLRGSRNSLLRGSKYSLRGSRNNILNNAQPANSYALSGNHVMDRQQSEASTLRMNATFDPQPQQQPQPPLTGSGDDLVRDDYYLTPNFGTMNSGYTDTNNVNTNGYNDHGYNDHGSNSSWGNQTQMTNGSTFTNLKAELEATNYDKETPYAMSNGTHHLQLQHDHEGSSIVSNSHSHTRYAQIASQPPSTLPSTSDIHRPSATHSTFSDPDPPSIQSLDSTYKERHEYFI